ncbi:MAG: M15 family metallopeptidase [Bacteriovoracaceae bacterium]|nr:M15 family metallopeptidase [Bacteriovoracaceae bacterium]
MDELFGKSVKHLIQVPNSEVLVHREVLPEFLNLVELGKAQNFDIKIASGFRDYKRQLNIWNNKARGLRPLLDDKGNQLNLDILSPEEILYSILRWSAIPGFSRHHWGSDIDIYDHSAIPTNDYQVQLTPIEVQENGIFAPLHLWIDQLIAQEKTKFYRPFEKDRGGVAPERWHLSYKPTSDNFRELLSLDVFREQIIHSDILLKDEILNNVADIYFKYVDCP